MEKPQIPHTKKEKFLKALETNLGIVSHAANAVKIDRSTPYRWAREDQDFANKMEEIQNLVLDFAESKLYKLVAEGNPVATIFLLKTKGKSRGYVEKHIQELTGPEGKDIDINIEVIHKNKD